MAVGDERAVLRIRIVVGFAKILLQVHDRALRISGADQRDHLGRGIGFQMHHDFLHLVVEGRVHDVFFFGPIYGDQGDAFIVDLDGDAGVVVS